MKFLLTKLCFLIFLLFSINCNDARHLKKRIKRLAIPIINSNQSSIELITDIDDNNNTTENINKPTTEINIDLNKEKLLATDINSSSSNSSISSSESLEKSSDSANVLIIQKRINHSENIIDKNDKENTDKNIINNNNLVKEVVALVAGEDKEIITEYPTEAKSALTWTENQPSNNTNNRWKKDVEGILTNANKDTKEDSEDNTNNLNIFKYNTIDVYDEKDNVFPLDVTLNINDGDNSDAASHSDNINVNGGGVGGGHTLKSHKYHKNAENNVQEEQHTIIPRTPTSSLAQGLPFQFYTPADLIMPLNIRNPFSPFHRRPTSFYNPMTLFDLLVEPPMAQQQNLFEQSARDIWSSDNHYPTMSPITFYDNPFGGNHFKRQQAKRHSHTPEFQNAYEFANILLNIGLDENSYDPTNNNNKKVNKLSLIDGGNNINNSNNNNNSNATTEEHNSKICPFSFWSSLLKQQPQQSPFQPKQRQLNANNNNNNENIEEIDDIFIIIEPIEKSEIKINSNEQTTTSSGELTSSGCTCRSMMNHKDHTSSLENNNLELSSDIIDDINLIASILNNDNNNNNNNENKNIDDYKQQAQTARLPILNQQFNNNIKILNGQEEHNEVLVNDEDDQPQQQEHEIIIKGNDDVNGKIRIKKDIGDSRKNLIHQEDDHVDDDTNNSPTCSVASTTVLPNLMKIIELTSSATSTTSNAALMNSSSDNNNNHNSIDDGQAKNLVTERLSPITNIDKMSDKQNAPTLVAPVVVTTLKQENQRFDVTSSKQTASPKGDSIKLADYRLRKMK